MHVRAHAHTHTRHVEVRVEYVEAVAVWLRGTLEILCSGNFGQLSKTVHFPE